MSLKVHNALGMVLGLGSSADGLGSPYYTDSGSEETDVVTSLSCTVIYSKESQFNVEYDGGIK